MSEIERQINGEPEWLSKIDLIRRTVAAGASADELELFFHQAKRSGLDPLAKQIYFVKRQGKGVIQVGIDGLRLIADRTLSYAGSDDPEFTGTTERGFPNAAKVTVYKMVAGQRCPFSATARWDEYFPGDQQGFQWKRMPFAMLGKCAEALALRKAFPADMGGLYVHEEMDQAGKAEPPKDQPVSAREAIELGNYEAMMDKHDLSYEPEAFLAMRRAQEGVESAPVRLTGEGHNAFGYVPMRWPVPKMFSEPATESQAKMLRAKFRERLLDTDEVPTISRLVLEAYGLENDGSKAALSLMIDWAMNADDETLDRASAAAEAEPRPPLELE